MVYIYVLELENNKYYIGRTNNPEIRIDQQFQNDGSSWCKQHKPISILELKENCDNFDEDKITLQYMNQKGIENVRGGSFCNTILTD